MLVDDEGPTARLMFTTREGKVLFAAHLEPSGCAVVAEACARVLAASDEPDIYMRVPNPQAAPEANDAS